MIFKIGISFNKFSFYIVNVLAWGKDPFGLGRGIDFGFMKFGNGASILGFHYRPGRLFCLYLLWIEFVVFDIERSENRIVV